MGGWEDNLYDCPEILPKIKEFVDEKDISNINKNDPSKPTLEPKPFRLKFYKYLFFIHTRVPSL